VEVDGFPAMALAEDLDGLRAARRRSGVRLLPNFDPYVMGSRPRTAVVPEAFAAKVSRAAGWISPVLLVDGRAAGVWERSKRRGRLEVRIEPFEPLSPSRRRAAEVEAERLASFLGSSAQVSWSA
jgi:hypothetical protein